MQASIIFIGDLVEIISLSFNPAYINLAPRNISYKQFIFRLVHKQKG